MARPKEFDEDHALTKATEVFWRNGYHNSSMQELVAETGVCRASLYETYGDKHALYLKALAHHRAETTRIIGDRMTAVPTNEGKIRAFFGFVVDQLLDEMPCKGCFVTNATLEMLPDYGLTVGQLITDNLNNLERLFTDLLEQGVAAGEFRADLPVAETARFLLSMIGGLNVVGKAQPDRTGLTGIVEVGLRLLR